MLFLPGLAGAWENHEQITRLALQSYEHWEDCPFEPIEKVLPSLKVGGAAPAATRAAFADLLVIHGDKVGWDWQPASGGAGASESGTPDAAAAVPKAIELLIYSSVEPDGGMDQNLNISPDQKYMGGYEGLSSQGIRHMFFPFWTPTAPLASFHYPLHNMGFAPDRAALFFDLARQAHDAGHLFWAYRFLGWGVHYVEDMGQPYHATQFGSLKLLAFRALLTVGWEAFIAETTRVVSNFHLAFERYTEFFMQGDSTLNMAFKVPKGDDALKQRLEQKGGDITIKAGVELLARSSAELAPDVVDAENELFGETLFDPNLVLSQGFYAANNKPKIDFAAIERSKGNSEAHKRFFSSVEAALSNTGVAVRWFVDQFKTLSPDK